MGPRESRRGFMDGTAYWWELGSTDVEVYPSALSLAQHHGSCLHECGIVEVEVKVCRVLLSPQPNSDPPASPVGTAEDRWRAFEAEVEAGRPGRIARLESRIRQLQRQLGILKGERK